MESSCFCFLENKILLGKLVKRLRGETYLYLVIKTCRKMVTMALVYSAPGHCLIPRLKGIKFFDIVSLSRS